MLSTIDRIRDRLPQFYRQDDSKLIKLLNAFTQDIDTLDANIDRVSDMDGIDITNNDDLYVRWGSMLAVPRLNGESDESYRSRIKLAVKSLSGGTVDSIRFSISVGMNNNHISNNIQIYDGWEYTGSGVEDKYKVPGNVICIVDMDNGAYSPDTEQIIRNAVDSVKATGVMVHISFYNYRVEYYIELASMTYSALKSIEYDKIGGI